MLNLGDKVRVRVRFRNPTTGLLTDPTTVRFKIKLPDRATVLEYQYGIDSEITRESAGVYVYVRDNADHSGRWFFEAAGAGALVVVVKGAFDVSRSQFSAA